MAFNDLLSGDRIVMLVEPVDRRAVLHAAARLLSGDSPAHTGAIGDSLLAREKLGGTGIGHGVAIPHGRTSLFKHARGAFLRLAYPVDFGASDGQPVDLVFALLVPEHFNQQHLQLLSQLAERFVDAGFRDALRCSADVSALRRTLLGHRARDPAAA